ncbi:uncharacterized protein [Equus caballus]|uniref:uncharacterized protein isoform X3 n=1 Tax=Equus caballus TaxID=9796 RepID=UPI0038B3DC9F
MSGERVLGDQGTKKDKGIPRNVPNLIRSPPPPRVWFPDTLLVPPSREPGDLIKAVASAHLLIAQSTPQLSRCVAQEGDMDEMEAAMHGRRLARSTQGDKAPPTGKTKGLTPREMCFEEKEYDCHPYERRRKKGILETAEASHSREGITRPSLAAKGSRRKRRRSPEGSPGSSYQENGHREAKVRRRPSPVKGRPKDKHDPSRAGCPCRAGSAHTAPQLKNRRTLPGSPERTAARGRRQDRREAGPASPKCRRHLSPEARAPLSGPLSRLFNHVGALDVALGELRAPGGAFLPLPARGPQPAASQRAWLSWQLAQAGATLHGAGAALDALLAAAQPRPACPQPSLPAAPRP